MILRPLLALLLLGACAPGIGPIRYDLPALSEGGTIPVSVGSVEVREVSLPLYAGQEVIALEAGDGQLLSNEEVLWADDPRRSITQGLALTLAARTRARVAAEPWPFFESPDVRVEVRFLRALAGNDGRYRIAGQYFVASADGERRDVARRFEISQPWVPGDLSSLARAKAAAVAALAERIARDGL